MRKLGIILFGLMCLMLMAALSYASGSLTEYKVESNGKVKVAWEEPTFLNNGDPIPQKCEIGYLLYLRAENEEYGSPLEVNPTVSTIKEVSIPSGPKRYFLGVQAVCVDTYPGQPKHSRIASSDNATDTNNHPWCVKCKK